MAGGSSAAVDGPVLFYDGPCGLCNAAVRLVLRFDRRGRTRFAPLQGELAGRVLEGRPELRGVDSLVWVENLGDEDAERVFVRSEGLLRTARHLGGVWSLAGVVRLVPRGIRDRAYDLVARHRHRLFGRHEACPVPSPGERSRFLP